MAAASALASFSSSDPRADPIVGGRQRWLRRLPFGRTLLETLLALVAERVRTEDQQYLPYDAGVVQLFDAQFRALHRLEHRPADAEVLVRRRV